jgi:hypothetical protein
MAKLAVGGVSISTAVPLGRVGGRCNWEDAMLSLDDWKGIPADADNCVDERDELIDWVLSRRSELCAIL